MNVVFQSLTTTFRPLPALRSVTATSHDRTVRWVTTRGSKGSIQLAWVSTHEVFARAVRLWFTLSDIVIPSVQVDGVVVKHLVGTHKRDEVWVDDGVTVFHTRGDGLLCWMTDATRPLLYALEDISMAAGGNFVVVTPDPLDETSRATMRAMINGVRPGTWWVADRIEDSTSLEGRAMLTDFIRGGVYHGAVGDVATWLREVLAAFKIGVPGTEDVEAKLGLERRLRETESVTGSLRPLVFTLEAIADQTYPWPGLWVMVDTKEHYRTDAKWLLVWDATLHAVAAAARLHVGFKPGLSYRASWSESVLRRERRFSKRDSGVVDTAYVMVNPARLQGPPAVVAGHLLQAATHELAHLVQWDFVQHQEPFVARREHLAGVAAGLLPILTQLVQDVGPDQPVATKALSHAAMLRALGTRSVPPVAWPLAVWVREMLLRSAVVDVEYLTQSWASMRNLTEGRARRDVEEGLTAMTAEGLCAWTPNDLIVRSMLFPPSS